MKLQVKTLDRSTFRVTFSEFQTVGELKEHVCRLRGAWVRPEAQQLLYAGQVLDDGMLLRTYCIDERKFLIMLPRPSGKKLQKAHPTNSEQSVMASAAATRAHDNVKKVFFKPISISTKEAIMKLGQWTEKDVRRALLINLNNPSRAIHYLKNKIDFFPKMVTPPASNIFLCISHDSNANNKPESVDQSYSHDEDQTEQEDTSSQELSERKSSMRKHERKIWTGFPPKHARFAESTDTIEDLSKRLSDDSSFDAYESSDGEENTHDE